MDYKTLTFEQIVAWCKVNKKTAWLKDYAKANPNYTYLVLKKAFCEEFMPEIIPQAKPKKLTMAEIIAAL